MKPIFRKRIVVGFLTIATALAAYSRAVADEREPIGSMTSFTRTTNNNQIILHMHNNVSGSNWIVNCGPVPITLPHTYKDRDTGIIFYVENDGRHVTAISPEGKILWSRDPFADAHLEYYRTKTPRIVFIDEIDKSDQQHKGIVKAMARKGIRKFICITYNSSQSGCLDFKNGDFTFLGQD